jgi:hypothetical protein
MAVRVEPPDLPELDRLRLLKASDDGELAIDGVLVDHADSEPVHARRVRITESESELHGLRMRPKTHRGSSSGTWFSDCGLSNVNGR